SRRPRRLSIAGSNPYKTKRPAGSSLRARTTTKGGLMATPGPSISPTLRYRDASAAIQFLHDAFGFEQAMMIPGENGTIAHAQLRYGNGMVMLGSASEDPDYGR